MSEPPAFEPPPPVEPLPVVPRPGAASAPDASPTAPVEPVSAAPSVLSPPAPAAAPPAPPAPPLLTPPPLRPSYAPSPAPMSRGARVGLVVGIATGALVLVGLLTTAVVAFVNGTIEAFDRDVKPDQPLVSGDPGVPVAQRPLECEGPCFDETSLPALTAPDERFSRLGLIDETTPPEFADPVPAGELIADASEWWLTYHGTPDQCFFVTSSAPYAATYPSAEPDSADTVVFLATHEDRDRIDLVDHSARLFPDTAAATAYLAGLAAAVSDCEGIEVGPDDDRQTATITPMPALALPDEVAAAGWVREGTAGPRWRCYVVDLQRGNVVVRIRLFTDGLITEHQFRNTVELYAKQLATVEPVGATVSP